MEIIWVNIAHMKDKEGNSKESGSMFHVTEDIRSEWYRDRVCRRLYILFILIKTWF